MTDTPETPSDEELSRLYYAGLTENGRENRTTVAAGNDARRALYNAGLTRGERRGIEMAIERLRTYDKGGGRSVPNALAILESLRAAPAGKPEEDRLAHANRIWHNT